MKITSIELSEDELKSIFNELTKRFNTEDKRQVFECDPYWIVDSFDIDKFTLESTLELYTECPEVDENNQTAISYRSVVKFSITFFYDGEEIKVNSEKIYELINKYYEI